MLLWRIKCGACLLPVSQPTHPREAVPAKLFHGSEFVRIIHPFPITIRILIADFAQRKSINEHDGHQRICNVGEQIERAGLGGQGKNMEKKRFQTHMIVLVNRAHFSRYLSVRTYVSESVKNISFTVSRWPILAKVALVKHFSLIVMTLTRSGAVA